LPWPVAGDDRRRNRISVPSRASPRPPRARSRSGESVLFNGTCSDPDGDAITHAWRFPGGSPETSATASPGAVVFQSAGTYTATYSCRDAEDSSLVVQRTVIVAANLPPVAAITSPAEPSVTITEGETVAFAASCTDPEGAAVSHSWSFPGGEPESSAVVAPGAISFAAPGCYGVTYTCSDGKAEPVSVSRTVTVLEPDDHDPVAWRVSPAGDWIQIDPYFLGWDAVWYDASCYDPDGSPVTESWVFEGGSPGTASSYWGGAVIYYGAGPFTTTYTCVDVRGRRHG
jgi:hypothetical protein